MIVCIGSMTPCLHASSFITKFWDLCTRDGIFTSFSSNDIS